MLIACARRGAALLALLAVLSAAVVVATALFVSARGFQSGSLANDTERISDVSTGRALAELDEEREHVSDAACVEVREALRLFGHGAPAESVVGPSQGHPPTLHRPPSAV